MVSAKGLMLLPRLRTDATSAPGGNRAGRRGERQGPCARAKNWTSMIYIHKYDNARNYRKGRSLGRKHGRISLAGGGCAGKNQGH